MNPFRLLVLGLLVWFVWRVLKSWRVEISPRDPPQNAPRRRERRGDDYLPMARCSACGVHLPQEALSPNGCCGACERRR